MPETMEQTLERIAVWARQCEVQPQARLLVLCRDEATVAEVTAALANAGGVPGTDCQVVVDERGYLPSGHRVLGIEMRGSAMILDNPWGWTEPSWPTPETPVSAGRDGWAWRG